MKKSEKAAREKLAQYDIHTSKKGSSTSMGRDDWNDHTHREGVVNSLKDTLRTLRGK